MKKEAYYFSHDGNAQDDPKCIILIQEMGMEGYGIFWALVEKLRSESEFMLPISVCNAFALRWHASAEKVKKVITDYNLFEIVDDKFYSPRLKRSMEEKSAKAKESANYRWSKSERMRPNAKGMRSNAIKGKENKNSNRRSAGSPTDVGRGEDHNGNPNQDLSKMVW